MKNNFIKFVLPLITAGLMLLIAWILSKTGFNYVSSFAGGPVVLTIFLPSWPANSNLIAGLLFLLYYYAVFFVFIIFIRAGKRKHAVITIAAVLLINTLSILVVNRFWTLS